MNARRALLLLVPLSLLFVLSTTSATSQERSGGRQGGTTLSSYMADMESTFESIQHAVDDDENLAQQLPEVCRIQKVLVDAKTETPRMVEQMEEGKKRDKALLAFRLQLQDVLRATLDLEAALLREDTKKAKKALREIEKLESAGHSKYRPTGGGR